jgi:2-oxoglutarate dehydrogenase E2 component (dihydrolipoamide succinyltransferase)
MKIEIRIPSPGESISEVELAKWLVENGSWVERDQEIAEVESEKATLPLLASNEGVIEILIETGSTVKVNQIACTIDTAAQKPKGAVKSIEKKEIAEEKVKTKPRLLSGEAEIKTEAKPRPDNYRELSGEVDKGSNSSENDKVKISPVAREIMKEHNLNVDDVINGLRRISSTDVEAVLALGAVSPKQQVPKIVTRNEERTKMTQLRKKLSQRLVSVKNETAMLTTFNEVDMSAVMRIRQTHQDAFKAKYGVKLGFMSFFTKAVVEALKLHRTANSRIEGDEIVTPSFYDIGIAVQTPKGLMVPVLRNVEVLTLPQIEQEISAIAERARAGRITLSDLEGGTFTITNGGVFGSLLSTPILNPPQSGILGMHNIVDRPIAVNGKVEIRPMMYIALSYDHRVIDGPDSVGFLVTVKRLLENPERMLIEGGNPEKLLLGL